MLDSMGTDNQATTTTCIACQNARGRGVKLHSQFHFLSNCIQALPGTQVFPKSSLCSSFDHLVAT